VGIRRNREPVLLELLAYMVGVAVVMYCASVVATAKSMAAIVVAVLGIVAEVVLMLAVHEQASKIVGATSPPPP